MLRTFDRDEIHEVNIDGVIVTVKMFNHTQETNYARFVTAPYMSGAVAKVENAVEITQSTNVAWASEADIDRFVNMIADCVTGFEGIDISNLGDISLCKEYAILKSLPFSFVMALGKEIEKLSTLSPDQELD
ncbi:MAG: hypothetical protein KAS32_11345 [Candidatus Peribacteraceae bacterium]|nr:hypothetical protein [Candidatus Peribacteraceae bacterium]